MIKSVFSWGIKPANMLKNRGESSPTIWLKWIKIYLFENSSKIYISCQTKYVIFMKRNSTAKIQILPQTGRMMAQVIRYSSLVQEVWDLNPEPIESPTRCQPLVTAAILEREPCWRKSAKIGTAHSWHPKGY